MAKKQAQMFIAMALCNFDDVILGGYERPGHAFALTLQWTGPHAND